MENYVNGEKLITNDKVYFIMTQNCTCLCDQCMRGDRKANSITEEVIDVLLSQLQINGIITLSGGEILMKLKRVAYLIDRVYELGNEPKSIEFITNGLTSPKKFEEFVKVFDANDAPLFVKISNDYYHAKERIRLNGGKDNIHRIYDEYKAIMEYYGYNSANCELEKYQGAGVGVSAIGRGVNIPGAIVRDREFDLHKMVHINGNYVEGGLQIMCDGRILPIHDMSWEEVEKHYNQTYNIKNNSLRRILTP